MWSKRHRTPFRIGGLLLLTFACFSIGMEGKATETRLKLSTAAVFAMVAVAWLVADRLMTKHMQRYGTMVTIQLVVIAIMITMFLI
jgi:hypothetical protein